MNQATKYPEFTEQEIYYYLKEHFVNIPKGGSGFRTVKKPLHAFKKVRTKRAAEGGVEAIANLIIPVGATMYCGFWPFPDPSHMWKWRGNTKFRASSAYVHSIVVIDGKKKVKEAIPYTFPSRNLFKYAEGKIVFPEYPFAREKDTCASGIHFFLTVQEALGYY